MNKARNDISFLLQSPIAHRGLHNATKNIPENSFAAFQYALIKKVPVEFDIRLLKDGQIVVYHDATLPDGRPIADCTRADLPKLADHSQIPLLTEILKRVSGKIPLLIEFKPDRRTLALERAALPLLQAYDGKLAIQSFDPRTLKFFKKFAPTIPRGQLIAPKQLKQSANLREYLAHHRPDRKNTAPDFISAPQSAIPETNLPVLVWTVRDNITATQLKNRCANIICENLF